MRIKINFTKSIKNVPVNNQSLLNSYIHKCLGVNNVYHDAKNTYAISNLRGGTLDTITKMVSFDEGAYIIVSSNDNEFINKLLSGILLNPSFTHGMEFAGVDFVKETLYNGINYFVTLSPFIIKEYYDKKNYRFVTLDDSDFEVRVENYLKNKISKINPKLNLQDFKVTIPNNIGNKVKKVLVKNVINLANQCHITINTNKKVADLLYNIGIGQSTGSGFGTIYKTENHSIYHSISKELEIKK